MYQFVKDFFAKHDLDIQTIGSVCTDGAPAMLEKREILHLQVTYYFLHHHALTAKTLSPTLKKVLDTCAKIINWIRGCALNHHIFKLFCEDLENEYTVLFFHTEVHWLLQG